MTLPTTEQRTISPLHALCPYFAMFPSGFARSAVLAHTQPGDYVLDPFSGRGTTLLESLLLNRNAIATDINPVAYCLTTAKARLPRTKTVMDRLTQLESLYPTISANRIQREIDNLPQFFHSAFYHTTLSQLLFLRTALKWRTDETDCFIAALCLGSLHGDRDKSPNYFSNQMPRTISTKPAYSLQYWRKHKLRPHKRDVFRILSGRLAMRYQPPVPRKKGISLLADARELHLLLQEFAGTVQAIVTSPPYLDVTRYEEDQWLRLWFLGGTPFPTYNLISQHDRLQSKENYWRFLGDCLTSAARLLRPKGVIVMRLGARGIKLDELLESTLTHIRKLAVPLRALQKPVVTELRNRQAKTFLPKSKGCKYEIDFTFCRR